LRLGGRSIENMDLETALRADQRRQQTDRTGARHQQPLWRKCARSPADIIDLIPGFDHDAGRLDQHARQTESSIDLDGEFRLDAKALSGVTMSLLDAALGVSPVAAHVPFADGAGRTRQRIGAPHDADDQIARNQTTIGRGSLDTPERFMSQHQSCLTGRRGTVGT